MSASPLKTKLKVSIKSPVQVVSNGDAPNSGSVVTEALPPEITVEVVKDNPQPAPPTTPTCAPPLVSKAAQNAADSVIRQQIQQYLHTASGQLKIPTIQELEHSYAKPFNKRLDSDNRTDPAKFLFMKHFPSHLTKLRYQGEEENEIDIMFVDEQKKIPFLTPKSASLPVTVDEEEIQELDSLITSSWTCEMNKLWTKANKIVFSDRVARLSIEGNVNEVLLKRNLQEQTANKFRELFASTFWDMKLITWLHTTILEHLHPSFQPVYFDSLQTLRQKIPSLIDKFYNVKVEKTDNKSKPLLANDPMFNTLSHYKLKKLPRKPVFILVPSGPNTNLTTRQKYWNSMISQMGKLVPITVQAKPSDYLTDMIGDIRIVVSEKIKQCKTNFPNRPIILIGFNAGSIIAAHCALQNFKSIFAVVSIGFPLKSINGNRGDLDDPLLDLLVPIQFVIGENSLTAPIDDMEDFRERLGTITSLVVVGGANDRLLVSNTKKRMESLTQSLVDRCVADEIFNFLENLLDKYDENGRCLMEFNPAQFLRSLNLIHSIGSPPMITSAPKKRPSKKRPPKDKDGNTEPKPNQTPQLDAFGQPIPPKPKRKRPPKKRNSAAKLESNLIPSLGPNMFIQPLSMQPLPSVATVAQSPSLFNTAEKPADLNLNSVAAFSPLPGPPPKKVCKKASTLSIPASLPTIKEDSRVSYNEQTGLSQLSALLQGKQHSTEVPVKPSGLLQHQLTIPTTITPITVPQTQCQIPAAPLTSQERLNSPSKDSYTVTEHHLFHQNSTRTGRTIKPPKSLDI